MKSVQKRQEPTEIGDVFRDDAEKKLQEGACSPATEEYSTSESDTPSGTHRKAARIGPLVAKVRNPWTPVEEFEHEGFLYRLQRRPVVQKRVTHLTQREREVLDLCCQGLSRRNIAKRLGVVPSTVGVLIHRASTKLGVNTRKELLVNYRKLCSMERLEK